MLVYLDLCCLKRPFDSQEQVVVRLQTEAVLSILALPADTAQFLRAPAHLLENSFNPVRERQEAVALWLGLGPLATFSEDALRERTAALISLGFKGFDSLHIASAELGSADLFLTVDRSLLRRAEKLASGLRVRVLDPVRFVEELPSWKT